MKKRPDIKIKNGKKYFFKFTPLQRAQHITIASCVIVLVLTGMPLKFHEAFWAHPIYALFGGIKMAPADLEKLNLLRGEVVPLAAAG